MKVCLDATPLLGQRTGVGRYTEHLLTALAALPVDAGVELSATAFTWRGAENLEHVVPAGVTATTRRAPARLLQARWMHTESPKVEKIAGELDVFHGTNFVLPPHRARGVLTVHDLSYLHHPETVQAASRRYQRLVPRSIARAAVVCTPTQHIAELLQQEYDLEGDRIMVTPLGVEPEWFTAKRGEDLPEEYVLFVGTKEPRKNLQRLIAAYTLLEAAPPLVLVGADGWGEQIDTSAISNRIITTGYLDTLALREAVAGASLLAMPSLDEGFGLPAIEAMAAGVPVVVSDIPVFRESLGAHARYVDPLDVEAIKAALEQTLSDRGPTTVNDRRTQASQFTWQRCAEQTLAAYVRALS